MLRGVTQIVFCKLLYCYFNNFTVPVRIFLLFLLQCIIDSYSIQFFKPRQVLGHSMMSSHERRHSVAHLEKYLIYGIFFNTIPTPLGALKKASTMRFPLISERMLVTRAASQGSADSSSPEIIERVVKQESFTRCRRTRPHMRTLYTSLGLAFAPVSLKVLQSPFFFLPLRTIIRRKKNRIAGARAWGGHPAQHKIAITARTARFSFLFFFLSFLFRAHGKTAARQDRRPRRRYAENELRAQPPRTPSLPLYPPVNKYTIPSLRAPGGSRDPAPRRRARTTAVCEPPKREGCMQWLLWACAHNGFSTGSDCIARSATHATSVIGWVPRKNSVPSRLPLAIYRWRESVKSQCTSR